jgi:hypothetical protein
MFPFLKKDKDEPVKIRFMFEGERLTWKYLKIWRRLTNGESRVPEEEMQALAAHFMVDKDNKYLPEAKAIEILDDLSPADMRDVLQKFAQAISESAVPPTSGSASTSPSDLGQAATLPAGQQP